jgi:hypothetical protein
VIESYEHKGYWWLPTDESNKLSGTLTITRGRAELDLLGQFDHNQLRAERVPRILGQTTKGKAITLEDCPSFGSSLNFPGISTTTYSPRIVLVGAWFLEGEEVTFDEIAIRTSELDTWVGVSGFSQKITGGEQPGTGHFVPSAFDIRFEPAAPIVIPLDQGEEAKIEFGFQQSGMSPVTTEISMSQKASLRLRYGHPKSLEGISTSVGQLRNFLSLAIGKPVTVISVTGFKDDFIRQGATHPEPIEVLWEIPRNPDMTGRPLHPTEMFFTLSEASPSLSEVMKAWFSRQKSLRPVLNLFFGMLYEPRPYRDVQFILYAQAIETYDSRRRSATDLPEDEHTHLVTAVLAATSSPQHRKWLRERISHNRPTLRQRMKAVLNECPAVRGNIIGPTEEDVETFVDLFVASRNYYTHYDPSGEGKAAKGTALLVLIFQLRAAIEMALLRELGFEDQAIDRILERARRYEEIRHFKNAAEEGGD